MMKKYNERLCSINYGELCDDIPFFNFIWFSLPCFVSIFSFSKGKRKHLEVHTLNIPLRQKLLEWNSVEGNLNETNKEDIIRNTGVMIQKRKELNLKASKKKKVNRLSLSLDAHDWIHGHRKLFNHKPCSLTGTHFSWTLENFSV